VGDGLLRFSLSCAPYHTKKSIAAQGKGLEPGQDQRE